jgi:chromosome segregation ATPase
VQAESKKAQEGLDPKSKEYKEAWSKAYTAHRKELDPIRKELQSLSKQIGELVPAPQRKAYIWLYERL